MKKIIFLIVISTFLWMTMSINPKYFKGESPNMKNGHFYNSFEEQKPIIKSSERHKGKSFFHWVLNRKKTKKEWTEEDVSKYAKYEKYEKQERVENLEITYITHSSFLIQIAGINLITDPIWSKRASPFSFVGPKRYTKPAFEISELPTIDYILITHNHYDHLDLKTIKQIQKSSNAKVLTGLGVCKILKDNGIKNCEERDWGGKFEIAGLEVFFEKAKHWSKRTLFDANKSLWGSFIVKSLKFQIYIAGDTGYGKHFEIIAKQYGSFDIALIPVGAYEPRYIMQYSHLNPEEAVMAHKDLKAKQSFGKHLKTFQLTDEGFNEPAEDLEKAKLKHGIKLEEFRILNFGEKWKSL
jgi:L-ascorbate metabolism protein UlaG (beta-lactamase superfamily)